MPKFEEMPNHFKYAIRDKTQFQADSFKTKTIEEGIKLIMGLMDGSDSLVSQSLDFKKPMFDLAKAQAWVDDHKDEFAITPDPLFSKKGIEIFGAGKWNGKPISISDLENIVDAYSKLKGTARPHLKLGHNTDQKILASEGLPAAGWIDNLRLEGDKLICDFIDMPKKIFQLIKNRAFRNVSAEIYNNVDFLGEKFPKVLGAVALLGAELPGVLNLNDILSMYSHEHGFSAVEKFAQQQKLDILNIDNENISNKGFNMPPDLSADALKVKLEQADKDKFALQGKLEEAEKANVGNTSKIDELTASVKDMADKFSKVESEKKDLNKKLDESVQKEVATKIEAFANGLVSDKICAKADVELVKAVLSGVEKFSMKVEEKEVELDSYGMVKALLKAGTEAGKVNFSETTSNKDASKKLDVEAKVDAYMKENKVSYRDAYSIVAKDHEKELQAKTIAEEA